MERKTDFPWWTYFHFMSHYVTLQSQRESLLNHQTVNLSWHWLWGASFASDLRAPRWCFVNVTGTVSTPTQQSKGVIQIWLKAATGFMWLRHQTVFRGNSCGSLPNIVICYHYCTWNTGVPAVSLPITAADKWRGRVLSVCHHEKEGQEPPSSFSLNQHVFFFLKEEKKRNKQVSFQ